MEEFLRKTMAAIISVGIATLWAATIWWLIGCWMGATKAVHRVLWVVLLMQIFFVPFILMSIYPEKPCGI